MLYETREARRELPIVGVNTFLSPHPDGSAGAGRARPLDRRGEAGPARPAPPVPGRPRRRARPAMLDPAPGRRDGRRQRVRGARGRRAGVHARARSPMRCSRWAAATGAASEPVSQMSATAGPAVRAITVSRSTPSASSTTWKAPAFTSRTARSVMTRCTTPLAGQRQGAARDELRGAVLGGVLHQHDHPPGAVHQVHRPAHALDHFAGDRPVGQVAVRPRPACAPSTAMSRWPPRIIPNEGDEQKSAAPGNGDGLLAGVDQVGVEVVASREGPDTENAVLGMQDDGRRSAGGGWGSGWAGRCRG